MGCSSSKDKTPDLAQGVYVVKEGQQSSEVISDEPEEESFEKPEEVKEEAPSPPKSVQRDPGYIFTIQFKMAPLGFALTSARDGSCGYITEVYGEKNEAVKNNKLPLGSKLLKVNQTDVEWKSIDDITESIIEGIENLPVIMTFCNPDGLNNEEIPDPTPKDILTQAS